MTNNKRLLIIDDDFELCEMLSSYLKTFEYIVEFCTDPNEGFLALSQKDFDLIILDIMLPKQNGFEVCKKIRIESNTPIIFLSARGEVSDRIVGLEIGGDDFMRKPFEPRELVARIESILRRKNVGSDKKNILCSDMLHLDLRSRTVIFKDEVVDLTSFEYELLKLFMSNPSTVLSREMIKQKLRKISWDGMDRSIDISVCRIRQKIYDDTKSPKYLKTVWGEGYFFAKEVKHVS